MLTKCGLLAWVLAIFCLSEQAFAQDELANHTTTPQVGKAYEFNGLAKFISVPLKSLSFDKKTLQSKIVKVYDITTKNNNNTCNDSDVIRLYKEPKRWWSKSVYTTKNFNKTKKNDVVVIPIQNNLQCLNGIEPRQFVIDQTIVSMLRNLN